MLLSFSQNVRAKKIDIRRAIRRGLQRRIQNQIKHLRQTFFMRIGNGLKRLTIFTQKSPLHMFNWVLNLAVLFRRFTLHGNPVYLRQVWKLIQTCLTVTASIFFLCSFVVPFNRASSNHDSSLLSEAWEITLVLKVWLFWSVSHSQSF